ncbi:hypothetical protein OI70_12840 [Dickeya fangzhongdai]|nr:hypothetical protein LH89_16575 [Dickeya fangzhongdai]KGT99974.1 hypothetical protein NM75_01660 [Dickeya fangzhongdai]KHN56430.1 hypothetical protein OI70_12840 [Dickeya fangzhongdai]
MPARLFGDFMQILNVFRTKSTRWLFCCKKRECETFFKLIQFVKRLKHVAAVGDDVVGLIIAG